MPREKKQRLKQRPDGRYACRYKDQWFYGETEAEALAAREAYKQAEKTGDVLRPDVTLREYGAHWLPISHPAVADSTYRGLATHLEKLCRHLGDVPLSEIRPLQIKQVFTEEYLGLSQSYINGAKQLYTALFDSAMENRLCRSNPVRSKDAQPHKGTVGGHRAITDQERYWIEHLCTEHRAHAAVMVMLYAGLRPQEMKALDIDQAVDFENDVVSVFATAHLDGMYAYQVTDQMKTVNGNRRVPLFRPLRLALSGKHGPVITNADGSPLNIQGWKCVWKSYLFAMEKAINGCDKRWYGKTREHKAILAAGGKLPPWVSFSITPYDLRHSFCTWCRDHGVEMNTCIKWMGHADAQMILKIYDSVSDARFRREAAKLDSTFAEPPNVTTFPKAE